MSDQSRPQPINEETVAINSGSPRQDDSKAVSISAEKSWETQDSNKRHPQEIHEPTETIISESVTYESISASKDNRYWSHAFWTFVLFAASWLIYATVTSLIDIWKTNLWFG